MRHPVGVESASQTVWAWLDPHGCVSRPPMMDESRKKAVRKYHPDLKTGITVIRLLPSLRVDGGGFLTDAESDGIRKKRGNIEQVDELIDVLVKKENKDFDRFCVVLEKAGCQAWSNKLKRAAGVGKHHQRSCYGNFDSTFFLPDPCKI